jgi:hypothetical protein
MATFRTNVFQVIIEYELMYLELHNGFQVIIEYELM